LLRLDFSLLALACAAALVTGCSSGSSTSPLPNVTSSPSPAASATASPVPSPTASPTPAPTPVSGALVSPASLTFNAVGFTQTLTAATLNPLTVSGCTGVVTYGAFTNGTLAVSSAAAGSCTLTIAFTATGQTASIPVVVTSIFVPVN
jgi:PBP1b-binding outer membrane lipoprotein LpoB